MNESLNLENVSLAPNETNTEFNLENAPSLDNGTNNENKSYKNCGVADIVFLIDVTGSMQHCLDALKDNITTFINIMTTTEGNGSPLTDWRARIVGYRDYLDCQAHLNAQNYEWIVDNPFTRDVNVLKSQLASDRIRAYGGGDDPESLLDAMMYVADSGEIDLQSVGDEDSSPKWRPQGSAARIVIIFTDETYHPTISYPKFKDATIVEVAQCYNQLHIKPYFFVPDKPGNEDLVDIPRGIVTSFENGHEGLKAITSDQEQFQKLLENLAKGVSVSCNIQKTLD